VLTLCDDQVLLTAGAIAGMQGKEHGSSPGISDENEAGTALAPIAGKGNCDGRA